MAVPFFLTQPHNAQVFRPLNHVALDSYIQWGLSGLLQFLQAYNIIGPHLSAKLTYLQRKQIEYIGKTLNEWYKSSQDTFDGRIIQILEGANVRPSPYRHGIYRIKANAEILVKSGLVDQLTLGDVSGLETAINLRKDAAYLYRELLGYGDKGHTNVMSVLEEALGTVRCHG